MSADVARHRATAGRATLGAVLASLAMVGVMAWPSACDAIASVAASRATTPAAAASGAAGDPEVAAPHAGRTALATHATQAPRAGTVRVSRVASIGSLRPKVEPAHGAALAVELRLGGNDALVERARHHEGLEGRPRLEGIADGPIAKIIQRCGITIVWIEVGIAGHRQDLAGIDFDQHRCP